MWLALKKVILYFGVLFLFSAGLIAQNAQPDKSGATCTTLEHPATWMQCPVDDLPNRPPIACQEVNVCLPNCPKGYRQLSGSPDSLFGKPSCVLAKHTGSTCLPLNFQIVYRRVTPLVWHWRGELSESCAASHLKLPIEPVSIEVAEDLQGEATAQFQIVVSESGQLTDSRLLSFYFTALPARKDPLNAPGAPSEMAADTLKHLSFRPYLYRGRPIEFESSIAVHFKLRSAR